MFHIVEEEAGHGNAEFPAKFIFAQFCPQTDKIEVTLSPRHPRESIRVSDEIQVHLVRSVLGRTRLVGFTIFGVDDIQRKSIRQNGHPLRGNVNVSTVLRVLHRMELRKKEELFGKYWPKVQRALEKNLLTVYL